MLAMPLSTVISTSAPDCLDAFGNRCRQAVAVAHPVGHDVVGMAGTEQPQAAQADRAGGGAVAVVVGHDAQAPVGGDRVGQQPGRVCTAAQAVGRQQAVQAVVELVQAGDAAGRVQACEQRMHAALLQRPGGARRDVADPGPGFADGIQAPLAGVQRRPRQTAVRRGRQAAQPGQGALVRRAQAVGAASVGVQQLQALQQRLQVGQLQARQTGAAGRIVGTGKGNQQLHGGIVRDATIRFAHACLPAAPARVPAMPLPYELTLGWRYTRAGRSHAAQRLHLLHLRACPCWALHWVWQR
jgi:hypothetical protein